jgi:tetratricopeptide (TPR) repeat protein
MVGCFLVLVGYFMYNTIVTHEAAAPEYNTTVTHEAAAPEARDAKAFNQAIADYDEAIRLNPKDAAVYINRGNAWYAKQEYDQAFADYNEAIRLDPKNAIAYRNRGDVWYVKQAYDQAFADYNEAIRLDPKDAMAYSNRGVVWDVRKAYDQAFADYNEAIRLDPKNALAYSNRASLWATCPEAKYRDGQRAVESATLACKLSDWKDANHLDTLAAAYAQSGDFDMAVQCQKEALRLLSQGDEVTRNNFGSRLALYQAKQRPTP